MDAKAWKHHLEAQQSSGKTIIAYCAQYDLNSASFYKWRSLSRRKPIRTSQNFHKQNGATFKELILPPPVRPASEYRVSTAGSGFTLTIRDGFNADEVKTLLSLMSAKPTGC